MPSTRKPDAKPTPAPKSGARSERIAILPAKPAFVTAEHLSTLGVDMKDAERQFKDASDVYAQIQATPWLTQDALAEWAKKAWGEPWVKRLQAATALLVKMGRIVSVGG